MPPDSLGNKFFLIFAAGSLLLASGSGALGAMTTGEENNIQVFKQASPSVVFLTNIAIARDIFFEAYAVPQGSGSGFIWDKEGHVVTNYHVVMGGDVFRVTIGGKVQRQAKIVGVEPRKDIAVLKILNPPPALRPIEVGSSKHLQVGQKALAIGNPFGLDHTLTVGVVSALNREVRGAAGISLQGMIQTDAAVNPGNSGGPLLDSSGRLIGMNTMILSHTGSFAGVSFALPVDAVKKTVGQLIRYGRVIHPGIGVFLLPEPQKEALGIREDGVVVKAVRPGSPAYKAGLRGLRVRRLDAFTEEIVPGDVIVALDAVAIKDTDDLYHALEDYQAGDVVTIKTVRAGRPRSYHLRLINID